MVVTHWDELKRSIELNSVQILLSDHHYWGGLRATQALARTCQAFGLGLSMHSNSHLGISLMAMTHLAASELFTRGRARWAQVVTAANIKPD